MATAGVFEVCINYVCILNGIFLRAGNYAWTNVNINLFSETGILISLHAFSFRFGVRKKRLKKFAIKLKLQEMATRTAQGLG